MTIPEATTAELAAILHDPIQALVFAFEMITAISNGHNYDALDFTIRRDTISAAIRSASINADIEQLRRTSN